ncbi:MAG: flagellar protein FlaG [Thermodesulfobacteriota bacterium]|nr:flagellar protein FlaG [Thermodesulfobacteriota bacterium]
MNINNVNTGTIPRQDAVQSDTAAANPIKGVREPAPVKVNRGEQTDPTKNQKKAATPLETAAKTQEKSATNQALEEIAEELNEYMDDLQTNLGFIVKEEFNHQVVVEIKNRKTDELVKQIPAEELLEIKEKMEELTGLLFDQKI